MEVTAHGPSFCPCPVRILSDHPRGEAGIRESSPGRLFSFEAPGEERTVDTGSSQGHGTWNGVADR